MLVKDNEIIDKIEEKMNFKFKDLELIGHFKNRRSSDLYVNLYKNSEKIFDNTQKILYNIFVNKK